MAEEQPTQQPGIEGEEEQDDQSSSPESAAQKNLREKREKFNESVKLIGQVGGAIKKTQAALAAAQAAFEVAIALIGTLPFWATVIAVIAVITVVAGLIGAAAFFIYYRQPPVVLRRQGAHEAEPWNPENSTDRTNMVAVQSAAGLISNLQRDLANQREVGTQLAHATDLITKTTLSEEDQQKLLDKLRELEQASQAIQANEDAGAESQLIEQFNRLKNDYYKLAAEQLFAGAGNRLGVPWRFQPPSAKSCNYYAAFMAALYHAIDRNVYSKALEDNIRPGAKDATKSCPATTKEYLSFAAQQAGLTGVEVVEVPLAGQNRGPSETDWQEIRRIVTETKTPVVMATNFSQSGNQFVTIVGFGAENGKEAVYLNDPADRKAKAVIDPAQLHASFHQKDDTRWSGGRYGKYLYLKFP